MANQASIRKTLDRLAYASLVLDVCIAVITSLSYFDLGNHQSLLGPINYLLTAVVGLTIVLAVLLLLTIAKERQVIRKLTQRLPNRDQRPPKPPEREKDVKPSAA